MIAYFVVFSGLVLTVILVVVKLVRDRTPPKSLTDTVQASTPPPATRLPWLTAENMVSLPVSLMVTAIKFLVGVIILLVLWMILKAIWSWSDRPPEARNTVLPAAAEAKWSEPKQAQEHQVKASTLRVRKPEDVRQDLWKYVDNLQVQIKNNLTNSVPDLRFLFNPTQITLEYNPALEGSIKNVPLSCLLKDAQNTVSCKSGSHVLCYCDPEPPDGLTLSLTRQPTAAGNQLWEWPLHNNWCYEVMDGQDLTQIRWQSKKEPPNQTFRISLFHETIYNLSGWIKPKVDGGLPCLQVQIELRPSHSAQEMRLMLGQIPTRLSDGTPIRITVAGLLLVNRPDAETRIVPAWREGENAKSQIILADRANSFSFQSATDGMSDPEFAVLAMPGRNNTGVLLLSFRPQLDDKTQF